MGVATSASRGACIYGEIARGGLEYAITPRELVATARGEPGYGEAARETAATARNGETAREFVATALYGETARGEPEYGA